MGWWYCAIAAGFALLALDHILSRDKPWLIAVRMIIAIGFGVLGWMEFHTRSRRR